MVHKFPFYKLNSITARFSTSSVNYKNKDFNTYLDNSNTNSIQNRENGIYKIYDNLFLNAGKVLNHNDIMTDTFTFKLAELLEDLHDNNKSTIFNFYFLIKPDFKRVVKFDVVKLNEHFNKYPVEYIDANIVKFYKNTGLICVSSILVFAPFCDINNLLRLTSGIKRRVISCIENINNNVHKDFNNTIINYTDKVNINTEIMLIIHADFNTIKPIFGQD